MPALEDIVAVDCEMVVTNGKAWNYETIALARVAVVDHHGQTIYDTFVFVPPSSVKDYCTASSGVTAADLQNAPKFETVQARVRELFRGKTIVGHALFNDLAALQIRLPLERTRDTALYYPLREQMGIKREGQYPALRIIAKKVLDKEIQGKGQGGHDPSVDASTALLIYMDYRDQWEAALENGEDIIGAIPQHYVEWYF